MHLQLLGERFILLNEHFGYLPLATHHHIEVFTRPFHFYFTSVIESLNCIKLLSAALLSRSITSNCSPRCYWVTQLHEIGLRGVIASLNCINLFSVVLLSRSIASNCSPWRYWVAQLHQFALRGGFEPLSNSMSSFLYQLFWFSGCCKAYFICLAFALRLLSFCMLFS